MSEPITRQPCAQRKQRHVNKGAVKNNLLRTIAFISAIVFCTSFQLFAQSTGSATIRGAVTDPQGSVVSNATVSLINERTGDRRQTTTNGQGQYNFSAILPDTYTLQVETTSGFKLYKKTGLAISPSDTRGEDVTLEIGGRDETVTVSGEVAPIQTETGAKESTITAKQIENLSIIGRSALELTRILPGVVAPDGPDLQQVGFQSGSNASAGYTLNGIRGENNNVSIDGSRVTNIADNNGTMITPNPDMVQEVKVQTSNYAAEHGSSGVQITATTKGGGREFHGSVYDYVRNWRLNATDRSRTQFGIARPKDKYQYPGGNIGGPVVLPRFGEGGKPYWSAKDKLFFFFGYEIQRQLVDPGAVFAQVPTLEQRQGRGFTHLYTGAHFDLTPNQIDPIGKALLDLYPLPNFVNPTGVQRNSNYTFAALAPLDRHQGTLRFDYKINDNANMYVRLASESETQDYSRGLNFNSSVYELPSHVLSDRVGRSVAVNLTNVLSATLTNEVVFSGSKLNRTDDYAEPNKVTLSALGISNLKGPFGQQTQYAPISLITSWSGQTNGDLWNSGGLPLFRNIASYSVTDNLTKIKGNHSIKVGGLIEQGDSNGKTNGNPEGLFIFAPWGGGSTGDVFSDILTGRFADYRQSTQPAVGRFRLYNFEGYAQDSWKLRSNFTLEYGVRLAYFPNNYERQGRGVLFDAKAYDSTQGILINNDKTRPNGILQAAKGEIPKGVTKNVGPQLAPRLNFAWDISGKGRTVIRGGAGLFYNRVQGNYQYYSLDQPPNTFGGGCCGASFGGGTSYSDIANRDAFKRFGADIITSANPNSVHIPRIASMSLSLAKRLPFDNVLEISYVGTQGRHLPNRRQINFIPPGKLLTGTFGNANLADPLQRYAVALNAGTRAQFKPFPAYDIVQYYEFDGTSSYHSMQVTLNRQLGKNLTYFANYTFSKALGLLGSELGDYVDPIDARRQSYGVLPYDRTHIFNLSYNYYLPDLARGSFRNWLTRGALSGWQMSGITTFQSGIPVRLHFGGDLAIGADPGRAAAIAAFGSDAFSFSPSAAGGIAPVLLKNPSLKGKKLGDRLFDLNAIAIPKFGDTGGAIAPFYLRSPNRWNHDISFFKNFAFNETKKLQFRAGFFNIFNQAYPNTFDNDYDTRLDVECLTHVEGIPNGGGLSGSICDPTKGYKFTQATVDNFGKITNKHGHRIVELALKFYF